AVTPNNATRTISFAVSDGTKTSTAATRTVTVADTDQTPVVTGSGGSAAFIAGDNVASTPVAVDGGITVTDRDNASLASATVSITGNFHGGEDVLAFTNDGSTMGNIVGNYNSGTGVLTLTSSSASATVAQWQAALRSITYSDTAVTPNNATRTISFAVSDGTKTSTAATRTVTVADTDQTPVVIGSGGSATFSSGAVAVDGGITISDRDNTTLASATVSITANFHSGEDVLAFVNDGSATGNIAGSYSAGTGVLTLTSSGATATVAQWQAALRAVTYRDSAGSPDLSTRAIGFAVSDGVKTSSVATRSVTVLPPMPVVTGLTAASDTGVSHSDGITANATPTVTGTALANATVTVFVDGGSVGTTTADSSGAWQFTLTSALADGRHTVTAQASIGGHQSALSAGDVLTVDTTPPQALSVTPQSASVTSGNSMTFDVVFSEPVTGLAAGSINVIASGQAGGTVTLVTALDATHYRVQVSASGDTGTLAITVPAGATADLAGNLLAAPAVSSAVAVQPAPSVVVSSAVPSRTAPPVSSTPLSLGQSVPTVVLDAARPVAAPASPLSPAGMGAADITSGRAPAGPVVFGRDHFTFVPVVAAAGAAGPDLTPQALPDLGVTALVAGQPFSFSLPSALAAMREADATLNVRVTQHNGQPLPAWLHFDPQRGRFTGTPPAGWHKTLTLEVTVRDHGGHRGVTRLQLRADAQRGETAAQGVPAAGKQALNEQFRQHGKEGAVARLAHWLAG
ncbi:MAG: putative Ig domain-containing protein, partial [Paludibacterium sp.]|uniref:Ig-like domain-containing protein n=1 Tax=Paludibacterium sp. TaxID=1917523 RepID=UPI0025CC25C2